ncbi:MAG: hypothetical protein IH820_16035, partial [Bacteroidetes bacterium]|nr:hypothetical protein [Bacteroidota bacterium]
MDILLFFGVRHTPFKKTPQPESFLTMMRRVLADPGFRILVCVFGASAFLDQFVAPFVSLLIL